ncbi:short-chain dehydrogenase [Kaistia algarum]|uniref:SDR family NAD(P)-dependent oxidoreductase n=1 Tax=Kaistia algarum TaxID=2083279 RepID=UPI000CE7DE93|nr:SDR family NAD(P)-dependent oxidoreductase [Kaistia algarum]MCX5513278.1 SDR family NAD(P)-dependent oxidoreductase [Kaistia algarum]PPE81263.1 short-chain dehydrogenase [Kaistia algarum]
MLLEGKVAIITGASRGIGRACAVELARHGAAVVINQFRSADGGDAAGEETLAEVREVGGEGVLVDGDVADPATGERLVDAAVQHFGRLDIHVSNAGICPFHAFLDMPVDLFRKVVDVNLEGAYFTTQAAARQMVKQGEGGAIVAVSSISALVGGSMQTHYTPTKAGVHSLMQSVAIALGPHGIRCNSVMPGAILTDINRDDLTPDKLDHFSKRVPLGRIGEPVEVAKCVVFLASDLAGYVTGASLLVDGGMFVNLQ